jgi:hypothetical protein
VLQSPTQLTKQSVFWHVLSVSIVLFAVVQIAPLLIANVLTVYILVLVPGIGAVVLIPSQVAAQSVQLLQSPTQLTEQSVFWQVKSVSIVLFAILHVPPLIAFVLTLYVLVLVPVPGAVALIPSQVAAQAVQLPQSPTQLTEQSVLVHVEFVCSVLFAILQFAPPLLKGLVTLYVLVLVPVLGAVVLIPSQVATHAFHSLQSPIQLTEQSVFMHVLSVSVVLFAILHVPPLIASVLTVYVLVLVPVLGAVVLIPSQVAAQAVHSPQSPIQSTGQSVFWHVKSICCVLFAILQVLPLLLTGLVTL